MSTTNVPDDVRTRLAIRDAERDIADTRADFLGRRTARDAAERDVFGAVKYGAEPLADARAALIRFALIRDAGMTLDEITARNSASSEIRAAA